MSNELSGSAQYILSKMLLWSTEYMTNLDFINVSFRILKIITYKQELQASST